jgi:outer membrane protein assembly factor BamE (lipoprotein component of BamABCDE complex)
MTAHRFAFLGVALVALLSGCATTEPAGTEGGAAQPAASTQDAPEHALKPGMTAEAVRNIMGEPAEIKAMQVQTGKAETWIYHRTSTGVTQQNTLGTQVVQQVDTVDQTISLLMFNDRLMSQTQSSKHQLEYK